jgi:hypothetical protein
MATRFPPRARILVWGGSAGAVAGLFVAWLWQRAAVNQADCVARDAFCLPVNSWLAALYASPSRG